MRLRRWALHVLLLLCRRGAFSVKPSASETGAELKTAAHGASALRSSVEQVAHQYYVATGRFPPWATTRESAEDDHALHVVYALDSNRSTLRAGLASIVSLSQQLKEPSRCTIHLIASREDADAIEKELISCFFNLLGSQATPRVQVHELHAMPEPMLQYADRTMRNSKSIDEKQFMRMASLRMSMFYLHQYLPRTASRALWLAPDTLVLEDVGTLFYRPMQNAVAAVPDLAGLEDETLFLRQAAAQFSEVQGFIPPQGAHHFKTSVLLFDLARWRQRHLDADIEALAGLVHDHASLDQLLLNLGLHSKFDVLDSRWNADCPSDAEGAEQSVGGSAILRCDWGTRGPRSSARAAGLPKLFDESGECLSGPTLQRAEPVKAAAAKEVGANGVIMRSE